MLMAAVLLLSAVKNCFEGKKNEEKKKLKSRGSKLRVFLWINVSRVTTTTHTYVALKSRAFISMKQVAVWATAIIGLCLENLLQNLNLYLRYNVFSEKESWKKIYIIFKWHRKVLHITPWIYKAPEALMTSRAHVHECIWIVFFLLWWLRKFFHLDFLKILLLRLVKSRMLIRVLVWIFPLFFFNF